MIRERLTRFARSPINPQHACAERVTVVVLCVCVCLFAHAILAVRAIKSVSKDTFVLTSDLPGNIVMAFFLKLSYSKVRASFTQLGRDDRLWLMSSRRAIFRILSVTCLITRIALRLIINPE